MKKDQQLRLDAHDALRGCDDALKRIMHEISAGSPSIDDLAYAVRLRAKDDYKVVDKVYNRQRKKAEYNVADIRDIIGLRIVVLYRLDCLDIIPKLLDIIEKSSTNESDVFEPNSIEEVKIYSTNPKGDAQALPERLVELFNSRNIASSIEEKPSNYSSIHMVAWCNGKYRDTYNRIPIEIQIRTAFEDVWSEIDHRLKYKKASKTTTIRDEKMLSNALAHLNVMKTFVDGAAQYADQIRIQKDNVEGVVQEYSFTRKIDDTRTKLSSLRVPSDLLDKITVALDHEEEALSGVRSTPKFKAHRIRYLSSAIRTFEQCLAECTEREDLEEIKWQLYYYLNMEKALCHYRLGQEQEDEREYAKALKIYSTVEDVMPDRAVIAYRFALVLYAMNSRADIDSAITKMRNAIILLNSDTSIQKEHWIRSSAPRMLGVFLWKKSERIFKSQDKAELTNNEKSVVASLLLEAITVSVHAFHKSKFETPHEDGLAESSHNVSLLANNILYYAVEFLNAGGNRKALFDSDFKEGLFDELSKEIISDKSLTGTRKIDVLDTLIRYYLYIEDNENAQSYAKELDEVLASQSIFFEDLPLDSEYFSMFILIKKVLVSVE